MGDERTNLDHDLIIPMIQIQDLDRLIEKSHDRDLIVLNLDRDRILNRIGRLLRVLCDDEKTDDVRLLVLDPIPPVGRNTNGVLMMITKRLRLLDHLVTPIVIPIVTIR